MAIELTIKQGDQAAEKKDFLTAVSKFTEALKENPEAFTALVKRAQVYTKLSDYNAAKADISKAFTVAENRGKMADKATCYFRLGLVNYAEKDYEASLVNLKKAKELKCTEPALEIWIAKTERDIKKHMPGKEVENSQAQHVPQEQEKSEATLTAAAASSSSIEIINKQAPIKEKIRDEWYQSKTSVTVTIFAKDVPKDSVKVEFGKRSLAVTFPTSAASEYNYELDSLYGEIVPAESSYLVASKKIEIVLQKKIEGKWSALEGDGPIAAPQESSGGLSYPTSSKKKIDWSSFDVKEEEEDESGDFFAKLYKGVDEDTKRAMMKSYVESNGTVLTTNWAEAKERTFETSPPEGMEAKKWGQ